MAGNLPRGDAKLIKIVDAALATAQHQAGPWLACRLGCTQCCVGVFAINQLDAARLRKGMKLLAKTSPDRAARVRERAGASWSRLREHFPGDHVTGILHPDAEDQPQFAEFANDEPCPALDPESGACDLYAWRPMTCRVFGPPVRTEHGLGVCELCFKGATDDDIAACEMVPDPDDLESTLLAELEARTGAAGSTIVACCLTV